MQARDARGSSIAVPPHRDRLLIAGCILLVSALAWAYLVYLNRRMSSPAMATMAMSVDAPWRTADVVFAFTMWSVMMVGMMGPAATPMLLVMNAAQARVEHGRRARVLLFALGYVTVWGGFSLFAALAQWMLHDAAQLSPAMATVSPRAAGVLLIGAGAYQLTPYKRACLTQCQTPMGFLMSHWRDGANGALHMGFRHGLYCLGCCWALMGVLFAVGVMNLAWVGALTVFILLERVGPLAARVAQAGGVLLVGLGMLAVSGWPR